MKSESKLEKTKSENKNKSSEPTLFDFYNKCLEDVKSGNFWPEIKRDNEGKILSANEKTISNLPTEEVVKITRSKTFRDWFGNWDTDIFGASKVIDAVTQEPLLLYHGLEHDVDYKVGPGLKPKKEYPYLHLSEIFYATSIQEHSLYWHGRLRHVGYRRGASQPRLCDFGLRLV